MRGYVLAGGASSRMGTDKARLPERGWPIAVRLLERLEAAGLPATLIRRSPDGLPWVFPDGREVRVLYEGDGPRHPLRGVLTALEDAVGPVLVVPCDVPNLSVASLVRLRDAGALATGHPLVGVVPYVPDRVRALLEAGAAARDLLLPDLPVPQNELFDRNRGGGPWPDQRLQERLGGAPRVDRERLADGERARLLARGVVLPPRSRYAGEPREGEDP